MTAQDDERNESDDIADNKLPFFERLAAFGSSERGLLASFLLLLIAIALNLWIENADSQTRQPQPGAPQKPVRTPTAGGDHTVPKSAIKHVTYKLSPDNAVLSKAMIDTYGRDGVIAIRGLLSEELLAALDPASQQLVNEQRDRNIQRGYRRPSTQFHTVQPGPSFLSDDAVAKPFRAVAFNAVLPSIAAQLLGLDESQSLRLLRDIFLAKDNDPYVCGYHVDDTGFWPATADSPGVNAWIALDDMPTEYGGGFALAVGSHKADYSARAHKVTGSTRTFPKEGFKDAADMFANRSGSGTCNLKTAAPDIDREMEANMRVYEIRRGDVIFHDRWLFHRTVPFIDRKDGKIWRRYSVRYAPGFAVIPPGYGTEPSVLWNEANGGRTVDQVAEMDGPWYPKCWPSTDKDEMNSLPMLTGHKMLMAEERRKIRQKEIKAFLNGRITGAI